MSSFVVRKYWAAGAAAGAMCVSATALAAAGDPPNVTLPTLDIYSTTPLSSGLPANAPAVVPADGQTPAVASKVPAAESRVDSREIEREHAPTVTQSLFQYAPSVDLQTPSGNDLQPDVLFRGFEASPIEGTPQGLAVYQNGMRINEAFGDTVHWDFVPSVAVQSMDLISNNPAFGLNALGGAVSMTMKDGFHFQGTTLDIMGGSYGRAQGSLQWGKQVGHWAAYIAIEGVHDDGYRKFGGSDIRRIYADVGYKAEQAEFHLQAGGASNFFGAAGPAPFELLQQNWSNIYTSPQSSLNQVGYINATADVALSKSWSLQADAHFRSFYQSTVDGNPTNAQPCDPTQGGAAGFLCYNDAVTPAFDTKGNQIPDFSNGGTLGEIDRTYTQTTNVGATLQATNTDMLLGHNNHLVTGLSFDYDVTHFGASAELGLVNPDYTISGADVFLGQSGNPISIGPVSLRTTNAYTGLYALDAFDVTDRFTVTAGGRFNDASIRLQDQLGTALNGGGDYVRFNPVVGATYKLSPTLTAYAGYSESNRAPTPLELGCADPLNPCIIGSFLIADPKLNQVVARTYEAGFRGAQDLGPGRLDWRLGAYRTDTSNEILNVPDPVLQGYGYFQNVGGTRRQGIEAHVDYKYDRFDFSANYAYLDATFRNAFLLGSNSPFADANGNIQVQPGNQIPMTPHHHFKFSADYNFTDAFRLGADVDVISSQYFVGDASNQYPQLPGYWVANLNASYQVTKNVQLYARAENVFDNRYYTYGTFFNTTDVPNFANGGNPFTDPRSLTPARPQAFYLGARATF